MNLSVVVDLASWILIGLGSLVVMIGALGLVRMPDVFTRMHAAGMIDTSGAGLILAGLILQAGFSLVSLKLVVLIGLFFFTSPVATHALARAALYGGLAPRLSEDSDLDKVAGDYPIARARTPGD